VLKQSTLNKLANSKHKAAQIQELVVVRRISSIRYPNEVSKFVNQTVLNTHEIRERPTSRANPKGRQIQKHKSMNSRQQQHQLCDNYDKHEKFKEQNSIQ
jgi:hypothetical protein